MTNIHSPRYMQNPMRPLLTTTSMPQRVENLHATILQRSISEPQSRSQLSMAQQRDGNNRRRLAMRFRKNWMEKHPMDISTSAPSLDDSLTSLSWLQNLNIRIPASPSTPPASPPPTRYTGDMRVNPNAILNVGGADPITGVTCPVNPMTPSHGFSTCIAEPIDYATNQHVKPPYSYATLICMAMKASKKQKITLAGIYSWITENFCYFRNADASWQNSIRHNLSLNKCFSKVPRRKDEPGKGGFWRINPEYEDSFVNGVFKNKRRTPAMLTSHGLAPNRQPHKNGFKHKKIKKEPIDNDTDFLDIINPTSPDDSSSSSESVHSENGGLKQDINWGSMLHQDIEIDGVRIKTEALIDDRELEQSIDSINVQLSPQNNSKQEDPALEELLNTDLGLEFTDMDINNDHLPLDLISGEPLDLTVTGTGLKQPDDWLNESTNQTLLDPHQSTLHMSQPNEAQHHPWDNGGNDNFDIDIDRLLDVPVTFQSSF